MKRGRPKAPNAPSAPRIRMRRLTLDLSEPLHRAIKTNAAEEGVTMAEKLRALLEASYRSSGGKR
jgi:predicted DNA binding CopG/RHH family protein